MANERELTLWEDEVVDREHDDGTEYRAFAFGDEYRARVKRARELGLSMVPSEFDAYVYSMKDGSSCKRAEATGLVDEMWDLLTDPAAARGAAAARKLRGFVEDVEAWPCCHDPDHPEGGHYCVFCDQPLTMSDEGYWEGHAGDCARKLMLEETKNV